MSMGEDIDEVIVRVRADTAAFARDVAAMRGELDFGMRFHREAGLPGGDETVMVLYLAMQGLLLEHLTLPDVLEDALPGVPAPDGLMERIVRTIVP